MSRVGTLVAASALALALGASGSWAAAPAPPGSSPASPAAGPSLGAARTLAVDVIDERTRDLTIESPSVGTAQVRLLLPPTFGKEPDARYPVLYLLHGGGGEYDDWTTLTDVEGHTQAEELLVVMPAAASSALGPDEVATPDLGAPPDWETFHLVELRRILERDWRAGDARAIAGLSLGGYAAVMEAAHDPGLFRAVASFSGLLDLTIDPGATSAARDLVAAATDLALAEGWQEANPVNMATALAGLAVYVSFGDGDPGPLDPAGTDHDELEAWIGAGDTRFVAALQEAQVPATVNAYGPGTHSWAYWDRELAASLPILMEALRPG